MAMRRTVAALACWIAILCALEGMVSYEDAPLQHGLALAALLRFGAWLLVLPGVAIAWHRWPVRGSLVTRSVVLLLLALVAAGIMDGMATTALAAVAQAAGAVLPPDMTGAGVLRREIGRGMGQTFVFLVVPLIIIDLSERARRRKVEAEQAQATLARARLHALAVELQPHFLFNTLNAIATLVRSDPRTAEAMIVQLSDLLRATLDGIEEGASSLGDEADRLQAYVTLQRMRFGPRLGVTIDVPPALRDARIPAMVVQPLVENAMTHGIGPKEGPGSIRVTAERQGDRLLLEVVDDGVGLPDDLAQRMRIGLGNTRTRLAMLFPADHRFLMTSPAEGGTRATVDIPYQEMRSRARDHR